MNLLVRHAEPAVHAAIVTVVDGWWGGRSKRVMRPNCCFAHIRATSLLAEAAGAIRGFRIGFRTQTVSNQASVPFIWGVPARHRREILGELYERFFAVVPAAGRREVRCVTSPRNRGPVTFHRCLGCESLSEDPKVGGVQFTVESDGLGGDRVLPGCRLKLGA